MTDDIDRELRAILDGAEPRTLPIVLGGGPVHRCGRCAATFTATTWHVIEDRGEHDGRWYHGDICRRCADADPQLHHWQAFCDVADAIDALMQTAPDRHARELLARQLADVADHFAAWRWPDENGAST